MKAPFSTALAIVTGLLVLLGYFLPVSLLQNVRATLLQWALILAAFTLAIGIINLFSVHWAKIKTRQPGNFYSLVLILALAGTVIIGGVVSTPTGVPALWLFNHIQLPIESSLMALLAIVLLYAGIRLLRRRLNLFSVVFLATTVLVLLGTAPLVFFEELNFLTGVRNFFVQVLSIGGARGILIGVALGTVATGVRILIGSDRPYSG